MPVKPVTKEDILDKFLTNYPWNHWVKDNALKAMDEYAALQTGERDERIKELEAGLKKEKKENDAVKKYIAEKRNEALKNHGENFALLQFIQRLEEAFTWIKEIK